MHYVGENLMSCIGIKSQGTSMIRSQHSNVQAIYSLDVQE